MEVIKVEPHKGNLFEELRLMVVLDLVKQIREYRPGMMDARVWYDTELDFAKTSFQIGTVRFEIRFYKIFTLTTFKDHRASVDFHQTGELLVKAVRYTVCS